VKKLLDRLDPYAVVSICRRAYCESQWLFAFSASSGTKAVSPNPTTTVQPGKAACLTGLTGFENFLGPRLAGQKGQLADLVCGTALANGWYDQNDPSWAEVAPKLRENLLYLMNPFCTGIGTTSSKACPIGCGKTSVLTLTLPNGG
jgi:hypothetical protein